MQQFCTGTARRKLFVGLAHAAAAGGGKIAAVDFALTLIDHFVIAAGIRNGRVDLEQVTAGNTLQLLGNAFGVAIRLGIINDQQFFHGGFSFIIMPAA